MYKNKRYCDTQVNCSLKYAIFIKLEIREMLQFSIT